MIFIKSCTITCNGRQFMLEVTVNYRKTSSVYNSVLCPQIQQEHDFFISWRKTTFDSSIDP